MIGRAYYNEIDPYAAQWLRNLVAAGHIAAGDVDERSIEEVQPDDIKNYDQCHFFAGLGGWSLALRLAGWPDDRPVWTGSCPCQPFSAAGLRKDVDDPRHLWPSFHRLIQERRPAIVLGEQVARGLGRSWLTGVRGDLEECGYAFGAASLCGCAVGARQVRQRFYWVATDTERDEQPREKSRHGSSGRVGRVEQPVSWNRDWESALREFRAVDDGLSYGVASVDAARNAIIPELAAAFITATEG